jgi:short-subunit dehydrogenase
MPRPIPEQAGVRSAAGVLGDHNGRMDIRGAVALVTGASSGLGRATAELLAARGATVLAHGRNEAALESLAERTGAIPLVEELADPGAAGRLATTALAARGRVDLLVANAGTGYAGNVSTMDESLPQRLVAANLTAPIELTRALLPAMLERRRGGLFYVSSIAGRTGVQGEAVYAATKAGLDTFAASLRPEVNRDGVQVGVFVPGVIATAFFERRGRPYGRMAPRQLPVGSAATALVRLIETGAAERYLPRWLGLPVAIRFTAPALYRGLAGRYGQS